MAEQMSEEDAQRFWSKVAKAESDECWVWTAYRNKDGYGRISMNRKVANAHRVSWEIHNGPVPKGLWVLHRCDNPPCCNPAHLFLGTRHDNTMDAVRKGRMSRNPKHFGERSPGARLNEQLVRQIRALHATGDWGYPQLAQRFGVSRGAIYGLLNGRTWKHVPR